MSIDPTMLDHIRAAIVRVEAMPGTHRRRSRIGTAAFVTPRHLFIAHDLIKGGRTNIVLTGSTLTRRPRARVAATRSKSQLVLLELEDGEPSSSHHLRLARALPSTASPCCLVGYIPGRKGWRQKFWSGQTYPQPQFCSCRRQDCPYGQEERGWVQSIIRMKTSDIWCGGLIIERSTGQMLSLAIQALQETHSKRERSAVIGTNLSRMREMLQAAHAHQN